MTDRFERVKANVLNEIADDYEEIGQIMIQLDRWAPDVGISREEAMEGLIALVQLGLAKAYKLPSPVPLENAPDPERDYFYITPEGAAMLSMYPEEWFPPIGD